MICPKCNKLINLVKAVKEFEELPGTDELEVTQVWCNIWCDTCKDMTCCFFVEENTESSEIEVPALREFTDGNDRLIINFPKSMKGKPDAEDNDSL